jgi:hypothetical protein
MIPNLPSFTTGSRAGSDPNLVSLPSYSADFREFAFIPDSSPLVQVSFGYPLSCSNTLIVLSSTTVVSEFMEKNSSIVSDRPHSYLGHEVYGGKSLGLVHCGSYMRS